MFKGIFNRHEAGNGRERETLSPIDASDLQSASTDRAGAEVGQEAFSSLVRELSGLGQIEVSRAAKERGWASLQRELDRRPVRPAAAGAPRGARPVRHWRWAIASAAAAVAVIAGVLGAYGAGAFQTAATVAVNSSSTTVTSVVSTDTTKPTSPNTTQPGTSTTQAGTSSTVTQPGTSTTGTQPTSPSTTLPGTSTTLPGTSTTLPGTSTTLPNPSTTAEQQYAETVRQTADYLVASLANAVIFTKDVSDARALLDPQAPGVEAGLTQLIGSLADPSGFVIASTQPLTSDTLRVTLQITDRVGNGQGLVVEKTLRFAIKVHVTAKGALVTAINAGS